MIKDAETTRSHMIPTKDEYSIQLKQFLHSAYVDEEYLVIGSHVEESLCKKIVNHEYADFGRLLPRDTVSVEEDQRMELVNRNGVSFWMPVANRDTGSINNFANGKLHFVCFLIYIWPSTLKKQQTSYSTVM